ncbi:sulfotransferase family 2 domain-containing protein [Bacillus cereus group sp. MYBKT14-1]|uniref:sulfotransferase family 2 domain-containing protein n=1 Tax=unclassified Bacillus cereus group TaxID=2750818 RepID=UPI003F7A015F
MCETIKRVITHGGRIPHFQQDFPLILFWSHRSGCTSFANWFFYQIGLYAEAIKYDPFIHYYEFQVYKNKTSYYEELEREVLQLKKDTFKLVRNPFKRAVSSFLLLYDNPYAEKQWKNIKQYFYNDQNSNKGISFKQFLYYVKALDPKSNSLDPHFSQQYIQGEEKIIKNHIKLENFNEIISKIEQEYGLLQSDLSLLTQSPHHRAHKMTFKGNYADVDITDPSLPKLPTYKSFYDKETLDLVVEIFQDDFLMYQYSKDSL